MKNLRRSVRPLIVSPLVIGIFVVMNGCAYPENTSASSQVDIAPPEVMYPATTPEIVERPPPAPDEEEIAEAKLVEHLTSQTWVVRRTNTYGYGNSNATSVVLMNSQNHLERLHAVSEIFSSSPLSYACNGDMYAIHECDTSSRGVFPSYLHEGKSIKLGRFEFELLNGLLQR